MLLGSPDISWFSGYFLVLWIRRMRAAVRVAWPGWLRWRVSGAGGRGSEVGVDDGGVACDLGGGAGGEDPAAFQDGDPVADRHDHVDFVLDEQDADAPVAGEADDDAGQLAGLVVVEAGGGLVEEDHGGGGGQRAGGCGGLVL